ncbi:hypothetical protein [Bacillus wiedmannii]|uniref:hypothetical protein n=1 Tax=Bacillus wiedmannii TaxID=1890302 RepID=UPI003D97FE0E
MKKKVIIAIVMIIGIIGSIFVYKEYKAITEFEAFNKQLDKEYNPLVLDMIDYFDVVSKHPLDLSDWYISESGHTDKLNYEDKLRALREEIINTDVHYKDASDLKRNALNTISLLEDCLNTLDTLYSDDNMMYKILTKDMEKVRKSLSERNEILSRYDMVK